MKKITVFILVTLFFATGVSAQLKDTKWKGTLNIPDPAECTFEFKKDTLYLYVNANGALLETMTFSIVKDTVYLHKVSGQSPCMPESKGTYRFTIRDEKLYFNPASDDCQERLNAFTPDAWVREKS